MTAIPPEADERQAALDELLFELDIHMRIEDDLFYPAVAAASALVAIAPAEHRQVWDQLAVLLRTAPTAPNYQDEWSSFV
ncbi:hemerythrin domain-containing protein, partial [Mycobacterium tuberculosis]|uniref:hemerythrin domain-containing protein n=1 Tax=Mycobacterium tuberculosis TaxID=1773 RepID=UPI0027E0909E